MQLATCSLQQELLFIGEQMKVEPVDLCKIKTYPIKERENKTKVKDFAKVSQKGDSFKQFIDSLPAILKGKDFPSLVKDIAEAFNKRKTILWAMGDSVIKCGLNPIIINLMQKGLVSAIALQGAGIIHDAEIALIGETSEDVAFSIKDGRFGMVEETGRILNKAIKEGLEQGLGMGEAVAKRLTELNFPYEKHSLLVQAYKLDIPVTVHVAMGTDIIHMHPTCEGGVIGEASHVDFRRFAALIAKLEEGVFLNIGSAVILPEVFLKALSIARNLGYKVNKFTTVNLDMLQHYRPMENVVKRPTATGGKGYTFIGHHEIMLPLLARAIAEETENSQQSTENSLQKTEVREEKTETQEPKTEDREQKTEVREEKTENQEQKPENQEQKPENQEQKPEDKEQKTEDSLWFIEDREQKPENQEPKSEDKKPNTENRTPNTEDKEQEGSWQWTNEK